MKIAARTVMLLNQAVASVYGDYVARAAAAKPADASARLWRTDVLFASHWPAFLADVRTELAGRGCEQLLAVAAASPVVYSTLAAVGLLRAAAGPAGAAVPPVPEQFLVGISKAVAQAMPAGAGIPASGVVRAPEHLVFALIVGDREALGIPGIRFDFLVAEARRTLLLLANASMDQMLPVLARQALSFPPSVDSLGIARSFLARFLAFGKNRCGCSGKGECSCGNLLKKRLACEEWHDIRRWEKKAQAVTLWAATAKALKGNFVGPTTQGLKSSMGWRILNRVLEGQCTNSPCQLTCRQVAVWTCPACSWSSRFPVYNSSGVAFCAKCACMLRLRLARAHLIVEGIDQSSLFTEARFSDCPMCHQVRLYIPACPRVAKCGGCIAHACPYCGDTAPLPRPRTALVYNPFGRDLLGPADSALHDGLNHACAAQPHWAWVAPLISHLRILASNRQGWAILSFLQTPVPRHIWREFYGRLQQQACPGLPATTAMRRHFEAHVQGILKQELIGAFSRAGIAWPPDSAPRRAA